MEKKFKIAPPVMPNFIRFEGDVKPTEDFHIKNFTREEAEQYGQLMKEAFIKHWEAFQTR